MIWATTWIAASMFAGNAVGTLLGAAVGVDMNVGGIGFSVLFLLMLTETLKKQGRFFPQAEKGMHFWREVYAMAIVAMAASQDVYSALSKGAIAILAGIAPVLLVIVIVACLARMQAKKEDREG